jgi:hypothetical protein
MNITQEQFGEFENVRESGVCNMWDNETIKMATSLTDEQIGYIRSNYSELDDKFKEAN